MPLYDFKCAEGHRFERAVPLAQFDNPQSCDCGQIAARMVSAPRVISDAIQPMLGLDGKWHDSAAAYKASCKPSGNPRGETMHVIDGPDTTKFVKPKPKPGEIREAIKKGIQDVKYGRVKPPVHVPA